MVNLLVSLGVTHVVVVKWWPEIEHPRWPPGPWEG